MPHTFFTTLPVRIFKWVSYAGASGMDDREARRVKLTNLSASLIAITTLCFNALYALYDFKGLSSAIFFNFFCVVVYALVPVISHVGHHLLSKSVMVTMGVFHLFVLCWMLSAQSGLGMYYFATTFFCIIIFTTHEKPALFGFPLISVVLYLLTYFLFSRSPGTLNPDGSLLAIIHVSSFIGTFTIIGAIVWLFYNDVVHAEKLLKVEHERSESLLQNILPQAVITRLKGGETTIADRYSSVTVIFADIVDFTRLSTLLTPNDLVSKLNQVFSRFDKLVDIYGLEKIKTIGDAYMVACGLPEPRADHVKIAAEFALRMQDELKNIEDGNGGVFNVRIGIDSGPAVAGVIGTRKFAYDVWGDTVNTASRMESHGLPGEIQVSEDTYKLLKDTFTFEERGWVEIKGKGKMQTYLLKGMLRKGAESDIS